MKRLDNIALSHNDNAFAFMFFRTLVINETPARNTLIGGALVLAAVLFQGVMGLRSRK